MTKITKTNGVARGKIAPLTNLAVTPPVPDQDNGTENAPESRKDAQGRQSQATCEKPGVNRAYSAKIGLANQNTNKSKPRPLIRLTAWGPKNLKCTKRTIENIMTNGRHPGFLRTTFLTLATLAITGCAGQLVCEWQTENEQFKELIEEVLDELNYQEID